MPTFPLILAAHDEDYAHVPIGGVLVFEPASLQEVDINKEGHVEVTPLGSFQSGKLKSPVTVTFPDRHYIDFPVDSRVIMYWDSDGLASQISIDRDQPGGYLVIHPPNNPQQGGKRRRTHRRRTHRRRTHRRRTHRRHH